MKILAADNDFGRTKQVIVLADIMIDENKSVVDVANNWAVFARQIHIATSIASTGLKNPIIVLTNGDKYKFVTSAARIQFAVVNGYTHIDAIVLENDEDVRPLVIEQKQTDDQYLDPQYISRWWEENKC